ncbi:hypothetical protein K0M31_003836 [Melipona bicolor]|uniref:Uncharacterized protein n=1 Tax=Melipona bicolor TaxID=60889 RepID=A0AA40KP02_9HYME|nr:hypothetical protein K0M31_003836 [Melipona bicolor]
MTAATGGTAGGPSVVTVLIDPAFETRHSNRGIRRGESNARASGTLYCRIAAFSDPNETNFNRLAKGCQHDCQPGRGSFHLPPSVDDESRGHTESADEPCLESICHGVFRSARRDQSRLEERYDFVPATTGNCCEITARKGG